MEIVTGTQFDIKKAVFANHLQNAFTSHPYMEILEHEKRILDTINAPYSKKEFDKINKSEVLNIIKKLKTKKAPAITLQLAKFSRNFLIKKLYISYTTF